MGIGVSVLNDTAKHIVGSVDNDQGKIFKFDLVPGASKLQMDDGITRGGAYMLRCKSSGKKYSMHVIAPQSRGTKTIKLSDVVKRENRGGIFKATHKFSMNGQLHQAIRILKSFTGGSALLGRIPPEVVYGACGLAFVTTTKVGMFLSVSGGLGVVMCRLHDGWSGPSAFGCGGVGAGLQMGAKITRSLLVLNNEAAVKAFTGGGQIKLGTSLSVAVGPIGRDFGAHVRAGRGKVAACFSYAITKGFNLGVSMDGAILTPRDGVNTKFYGKKVKVSEILTGKVDVPENGRWRELVAELKSLEDETGMVKDGTLHPAQMAHLVVNQPEELSLLLGYRPPNEPIAHICAPLGFQERLDLSHAKKFMFDMLSVQFETSAPASPMTPASPTTPASKASPTPLGQSRQVLSRERSRSDLGQSSSRTLQRSEIERRSSTIRRNQQHSKAFRELQVLAVSQGSDMDLLKMITRTMAAQLPGAQKDGKFYGSEALEWILEGQVKITDVKINQKDRVSLMLARTLIAQDDRKRDKAKVGDDRKYARLFQIRVYVLMNLLLKEGWLTRARRAGGSSTTNSTFRFTGGAQQFMPQEQYEISTRALPSSTTSASSSKKSFSFARMFSSKKG